MKEYFYIITVQFQLSSHSSALMVVTECESITARPGDTRMSLYDRIRTGMIRKYNLAENLFSVLFYSCEPLELS